MDHLIQMAQAYDQIRRGIEQTLVEWQHLVVRGDYTVERLQGQAECLRALADLAQAGADIAEAIGKGLPTSLLRAELTLARAERRRSYWAMTLFSPGRAHLVDLGDDEREAMWQKARDSYVADTERVRKLEGQLRALVAPSSRPASQGKSPRR